MEHERLFGESNLNAVRDGLRVLRTIVRERVRRRRTPGHPDAWRPLFRELAPALEPEFEYVYAQAG